LRNPPWFWWLTSIICTFTGKSGRIFGLVHGGTYSAEFAFISYRSTTTLARWFLFSTALAEVCRDWLFAGRTFWNSHFSTFRTDG
jgi:hypothetical protein